MGRREKLNDSEVRLKEKPF